MSETNKVRVTLEGNAAIIEGNIPLNEVITVSRRSIDKPSTRITLDIDELCEDYADAIAEFVKRTCKNVTVDQSYSKGNGCGIKVEAEVIR